MDLSPSTTDELRRELARLREERDGLARRVERLEAEAHLPVAGLAIPYRGLIEQVPGVVYVTALDAEARTLYISPQIEALTGYTPEEAVGDAQFWPRVMHPEDRDRALGAYVEAVASGAPYVCEYRINRKDGGVVWVRDVGQVVMGEAGEARCVEGLIFDLSERKAVEARLRKSEQLLAQAQEVARVGSWERDFEGGAITWSDELYRLFGLAPQSVAIDYESYLARVHPDDREMVQAAGAHTFRTGEPFAVDYRLLRADGEVRWVHGRGKRVEAPDGRPRCLVGTTQDIHDRKQAEEELSAIQGRLANLLSASPVVIYALRVEGDRYAPTWVSDNLRQVLGIEPRTFLAPGWWAGAIHPADRQEAL
ncbi:MAG: PAS domain-containing protein, partial [Candidatus Sericytochromatia bacterium]